MTSAATGKSYDFRRGHSQPLYREVLLPEGAAARFRVAGVLWSAAECAELVTDRKTKCRRFRRGAELARTLTLALPKELTLDELIRLVREFVKRELLDKGVAVEIVIHPPDDPATGNIHCHILITSRTIHGDTFGKRATHVMPDFAQRVGGKCFIAEQSCWPQRWAAAQNQFFIENGIPLQVDPISLVRRIHEGPRRHDPGSDQGALDPVPGQKALRDPPGALRKAALNRLIAEQEAKILSDPPELLRRVAERVSVFDAAYLMRILGKAGIVGMEARKIVHDTLLQDDVVAIDPPPYPRIPALSDPKLRCPSSEFLRHPRS